MKIRTLVKLVVGRLNRNRRMSNFKLSEFGFFGTQNLADIHADSRTPSHFALSVQIISYPTLTGGHL
jgi:hypothetical protein